MDPIHSPDIHDSPPSWPFWVSFKEAFDKGCTSSEVGLALALATRGKPEGSAEACEIMEGQADAEPVGPYTQEAFAALRKAGATAMPELRKRIEALLSESIAAKNDVDAE